VQRKNAKLLGPFHQYFLRMFGTTQIPKRSADGGGSAPAMVLWCGAWLRRGPGPPPWNRGGSRTHQGVLTPLHWRFASYPCLRSRSINTPRNRAGPPCAFQAWLSRAG
jgi:hypothetical protein